MAFAAERERWALWLPVLFGLGIGVYFQLGGEPPSWAGPALALPAILCWPLRRHAWAVPASLALLTFALGFSVAAARTGQVAAPVLERRLGPVTVTGRVLSATAAPSGQRLLLDRLRIQRLPAAATPDRVRVTLRSPSPLAVPGQRVRLRAVLLPPAAPAAPNSFDFARHAWFQGLGAVGYAMGKPQPDTEPDDAAPQPSGFLDAARLRLNTIRQAATMRILDGLDGAPGAVAAALMTGERGSIPPAVNQAMQDSGLAHLLAISGLHLSLVCGIVFMGLRSLLAGVERLALTRPIKQWAALASLLAGFGYLLLSGASVPTQRAFLMIALVLTGMLIGRNALSMRLVAWAALVVLLLSPEALLGAGFQMSFAAVVALIAAHEAMRTKLLEWRAGAGTALRTGLWLGGVGFTTLVAGFATAPYALYHFHRFVDYGLLANLVAVPVVSLWAMPWAVLAFVVMPFGLEVAPLAAMGLGLQVVIAVAVFVAGLPGAVLLLPAIPTWGLAAITLGGLWLCLWRRRWRLFGLVPVLAGLAPLGLAERPDILVDGGGRLAAVRAADGGLLVSSMRGDAMVRDTWLRRDGAGGPAGVFPDAEAGDGGRLRCDPAGCLWRNGGWLVALVRHEAALEDCGVADLVVSLVPTRGRCRGPRMVIDRFDLWRHGSHAIYLKPDGFRVETVAGSQGRRPWSPVRRPRDAAPPLTEE